MIILTHVIDFKTRVVSQLFVYFFSKLALCLQFIKVSCLFTDKCSEKAFDKVHVVECDNSGKVFDHEYYGKCRAETAERRQRSGDSGAEAAKRRQRSAGSGAEAAELRRKPS